MIDGLDCYSCCGQFQTEWWPKGISVSIGWFKLRERQPFSADTMVWLERRAAEPTDCCRERVGEELHTQWLKLLHTFLNRMDEISQGQLCMYVKGVCNTGVCIDIQQTIEQLIGMTIRRWQISVAIVFPQLTVLWDTMCLEYCLRVHSLLTTTILYSLKLWNGVNTTSKGKQVGSQWMEIQENSRLGNQ